MSQLACLCELQLPHGFWGLVGAMGCMAVGIGVSLGLGAWAVRHYYDELCGKLDLSTLDPYAAASPKAKDVLRDLQRVVGHTERLLYFFIAHRGHSEVLVAWFTLKALVKFGEIARSPARVSLWAMWRASSRADAAAASAGSDQDIAHARIRAEAEYHKYFVGSGLSLFFGLAGGWISRALYEFLLS